MQLDNGMQMFLRDKDCRPTSGSIAEHKKQQEFERLRQMMKDENFKPATQPATQPTTQSAEKEKDL